MKHLFKLTLVLGLALGINLPEQAQASEQEHCVIFTDGTDKIGNLIVTDTECYDTYAQVLEATGATNVPSSLTPATAGEYLLLTSIIGTHYDGSNATGQSFSVVGDDCNGGGLPVPIGWNDRISSTTNGCPTVTHYEHNNYTGSAYNTFGPGTNTNITGYMNNKTSSIKYFN